MKLILIFTLLISSSIVAQTNVIAAKSHASNCNISQQPDNFGEFIPPRTIESVQYLKGDCIVEIYASEWAEQGKEYDTICNHPFLQANQIDVKRLKEMYPKNTEFLGFESLEKEKNALKPEKKKKKNRSEKSSLMVIFLIGGGLLLTFLFVPKARLKTS
jgi:hypothetical protein